MGRRLARSKDGSGCSYRLEIPQNIKFFHNKELVEKKIITHRCNERQSNELATPTIFEFFKFVMPQGFCSTVLRSHIATLKSLSRWRGVYSVSTSCGASLPPPLYEVAPFCRSLPMVRKWNLKQPNYSFHKIRRKLQRVLVKRVSRTVYGSEQIGPLENQVLQFRGICGNLARQIRRAKGCKFDFLPKNDGGGYFTPTLCRPPRSRLFAG